jgi:hypothetical protein
MRAGFAISLLIAIGIGVVGIVGVVEEWRTGEQVLGMPGWPLLFIGGLQIRVLLLEDHT